MCACEESFRYNYGEPWEVSSCFMGYMKNLIPDTAIPL